MTTPHYTDDDLTLYLGDCLDVMRTLPDDSVDSVVTDPPYGLGFMGREWDALPPGREWAEQCLRLLKPGGHMLAFGGTRTWHRLACAVEDAGFEIRDSIAWLYAQGFPKSLDVSKAIDKSAGAERKVIGRGAAFGAGSLRNRTRVEQGYRPTELNPGGGATSITAPATDAAREWQGWGTAMKPAFEPVVCARKPLNTVPLDWRLVTNVHHALAGLLWLSLSPAKRAELSSPSSQAEHVAAWCASARVSAAAVTSHDASAATATFSSPATASTCSSIASSWSSILAALSDPTTTSTTSTASSTTTALRTLNSLLAPITSQTTMPPCGCLTRGPSSSAANAEEGSSDDWSNWLHTLSASVPETATAGIALGVASVVAHIAESLSVDQAAGSFAAPAATTEAGSRSSSPAFEPVVVARKPLAGTVAANVQQWGTGALNIDGCRIGTEAMPAQARGVSRIGTFEGAEGNVTPERAGRWPANVVLDETQAAELDRQSGVLTSGSRAAGRHGLMGYMGASEADMPAVTGDMGGASRFFYVAKAGTAERPKLDGTGHPTVKPVDLMRWLVRLVTPPGGTVLEPFLGSGTTAEACIAEGFRCIGIERDEAYMRLVEARLSKPIQRGMFG